MIDSVNTMSNVTDFLATHGRLLDRRRYDLLRSSTAEAADRAADRLLAALAAYEIPAGGYGWALEPDLRSVSAQPVAALHAFEVFEELGPRTTPAAARLCDWLESITLPDGGLPFGLEVEDPAGSAPFFVDVDPRSPSLHMTAMLAAIAHRVGAYDKKVRDHSWLATATEFSLKRIEELSGRGTALEFRYSLQLLDAVHDRIPGTDDLLRRRMALLPTEGAISVEGGLEDEVLRPLDFSPIPNRPLRAAFSADAIDRELDQLVADQRPDGGWTVDWKANSPAAALDWRGWATVRAVKILQANGR